MNNLYESMNKGFLRKYNLDEDYISEKNWKKEVPADIAREFRKAMQLEDVQMKEVIEPTKKVLEWIKTTYPDYVDEVEDIESDIDMIEPEEFDFDDFAEYDEDDEDAQTNQDYFNYVLGSIYELCDNLSIWIPTDGMYEDLNEATNPENAEVNALIKSILDGSTHAKRDLDKLRKMGYEVEIDSAARKTWGRDHFGDSIRIRNTKTGKEFYASAGNRWSSKDTIIARPTKDTSVSNPDLYRRTSHTIKPGRYTVKDEKIVDGKAFDYKGYLDKETYDDTPKPTTVAQFAKDKRFLKEKEWEAQRIDAARDRVAGIRDRLASRGKKEESLNEDFSDQLPDWAQKAIKGGKWNHSLRDRLKKQNIDLANAEVEVIDVSTLTPRGVKTGVDENGNVLLLNMAVPGRYNSSWSDKFTFIPGVYNDDYAVTNFRIDKQQQMKYMPAKDIISYVKDAIIIKPSSTLGKLRSDRAKAKASSIDRGKGQYPSTDGDGAIKWYQASRQDKSGYPIPDINELFKKITYLTPDNYKERLTYADNKLNEVKEAVKSLLSNPNTVANLFTGKFGHFGDGILRELSDIEESVIKVSKYLDDIRKTADRIIADGDDVERNFRWLNTDYTSLQRFRSDIREINNDINKLLAKITPEEIEVEGTETVVEESLNEDLDTDVEHYEIDIDEALEKLRRKYVEGKRSADDYLNNLRDVYNLLDSMM